MLQEKEPHIFDYAFALRTALFWVFCAWAMLLLALFGIFYVWTVTICLASCLAFGIYLTIKQKWLFGLSHEYWLVFIFSLLAATTIVSYSTPTIFSGRDQGAISEAAISLAQNHSLKSSSNVSTVFFNIYGPGKALNFPGFHYDNAGKLSTQFPLGYISWLGAWYTLFGLTGLMISNIILLWLFLFAGYFFTRNFLSPFFSSLFLIFIVSSFSFVWFSRLSLSENLALALIATLLLGLLPLLKTPSKAPLILFVGSAILLVFVRIEGILILATSIIAILFSPPARSFFSRNIRPFFLFPLFFFVSVFILNAYWDGAFYREIAKVIRSVVRGIFLPVTNIQTTNSISNLADTITIWDIYGLLGFFIVGLFCVAYLFVRGHFMRLIPFFITLPVFYYLIDSQISSDHPWMLRRFMFAVLPIAIFYTTLLISNLYRRKYRHNSAKLISMTGATALCLLLLFLNVRATLPIATYSENIGMLSQIGELSKNFSDRDLVLVDRLASGDAWSMLSGPLRFVYGKQATYFFNPADLAKIDRSKFDNIYLIISDESISMYENALPTGSLQEITSYVISTNRLEVQDIDSADKISRAQKKEIIVTGKILRYE